MNTVNACRQRVCKNEHCLLGTVATKSRQRIRKNNYYTYVINVYTCILPWSSPPPSAPTPGRSCRQIAWTKTRQSTTRQKAPTSNKRDFDFSVLAHDAPLWKIGVHRRCLAPQIPFEQMRRQKMFQPQPVPFCLVGSNNFVFGTYLGRNPHPQQLETKKQKSVSVEHRQQLWKQQSVLICRGQCSQRYMVVATTHRHLQRRWPIVSVVQPSVTRTLGQNSNRTTLRATLRCN